MKNTTHRVGVALLPVVLAVSPLLAMAETPQAVHTSAIPAQTTTSHSLEAPKHEAVAPEKGSHTISSKPHSEKAHSAAQGHASPGGTHHAATQSGRCTPQAGQQTTTTTTTITSTQPGAPITQLNSSQPGVYPISMPLAKQLSEPWLKGQQALISKQYPVAISEFHSAVLQDPNSVHALHGLAQAYYSQGQYQDALQQINRAQSLDPLNSHLFYTKGQILDSMNKPLEALEAYRTFTAMTPDDSAALSALRRSDELYKTVEPSLNPTWKNYLQGLEKLSLHQPSEAIPYFEQYQASEPTNPQPSLLLGQSYLSLGQPEKAIPQLQNAIKLKADNPVAYYQMGSGYSLMSGYAQHSKEAYTKFAQYAPQSESVVILNQYYTTPAQQ